MRHEADADRVRALARDLGRHAGQRVRIYLTGGATAVLIGWRATTVDVDLRLEPEDDALMRRIPAAKEAVDVNIEFASPPDFIPEVPGWRDRCTYAFTEGEVDVYHFDPYSQALAKLERGLDRDLSDVRAMSEHGLIEPSRVLELYGAIEPELYRYPAIDPPSFRRRVEAFVAEERT